MLPNFLIIGAAKSGTTSLYYYLNQHPEIYMSPVKEPRFFALEGEDLNFKNPDQGINESSVTDIDRYHHLFEGVSDEKAVGEASPLYLYSPKAVERIKHYVPDAKLIAVLRNPVDRAFSCYTHLIRENYEVLPFSEALIEENNRIQNNWAHLWHYREGGYYYQQLKRYFDVFDREQIRIYRYEDLNSNSVEVVQDVFQFLGVNDNFKPDLTRMNVSGVPKSRLLHYLFDKGNPLRTRLTPLFSKKIRKNFARQVRKWNLQQNKISIYPEDRRQLIEDFREDILKLQDLITLDLSTWLE